MNRLFPARMAANVLGVSVFALVLAAIGIYGVMLYVVARTDPRDWFANGARCAIATRPSTHPWTRDDPRQDRSCHGLVIVFILARFLTSMLYGVSPTDPITFIAITFCLPWSR